MSAPDITEEDIRAVAAVVRLGRLALGPKTEEFERMIADYVGVRHAVAVSSGTAALHLIVKALGIESGDEVLVPSFTFASSVNVILFERATPVFVDIEPDTYNIDPDDLERKVTSRTKAIMAVDVFGHPAEWDEILKVAERYNLKVIDDSCEALGAEYLSRKSKIQSPKSQLQSSESRAGSHESKALSQSGQAESKWEKLGGFGDAAAFAFYPNKQMTTGEGGIVVTDSTETARICRSLRNQGRGEMGAWLEHERLGYNYRMTEMSAALGVSQVRRVETFLAKRKEVARLYTERLAGLDWIRPPVVRPHVRMSWFVYVVTLREGLERNEVMRGMAERGIPTRGYFSPMHLQPYIRSLLNTKEGMLPITESVAQRTIALPFHNRLSENAVRYVVDNLADIMKLHRGGR
jgi:perosamine synthetase